MKTPFKTRFAPSPTGLMHFGNLRTALFNFLLAKRFEGTFLLRIEDTDVGRSEAHFQDAILADLQWLGIEWQEGPYLQSERKQIYDEYFDLLQKSGHLYPCFCTEEELAIARKVQLASHQPPRYQGTCRHLTEKEVLDKRAEGIPHTLRFEVTDGAVVAFEDLIKGTQRFQTDHIGDFIIRRNDGSASFMFCNAIDDAKMGVTHALRGDDHLTNTPRQILILQALNLPVPKYGHFPTILGPDSRPLSKRNGSRSIQELRLEGFLPLGILNYLARLGHHDPDLTLLDLEGLCQHFNLKNISLSPAHYDPVQLNFWQKAAMHQTSFETCWELISPYVKECVPEDKRIAFVDMIRPNLMMPKDALPLAKALFGKDEELILSEEVQSVLEKTDKFFFITAAKLLEDMEITYPDLIKALQEKTGLKGKALFFPLRAAFTGELHGPELAKVLELLGHQKASDRLNRFAK